MYKKFFFLFVTTFLEFNIGICSSEPFPESLENVENIFSVENQKKTEVKFTYKEIRQCAKLSWTSYNYSQKQEALKKLEEKGWRYHQFQSKDLLGFPYIAGIIAFSPIVSNKKQKIIIAFRGTETIVDMLADISLSKKIYHPFNRLGNIHQGFLSYFQNSINEIKSVILQHCFISNKSPAEFDIITTGHSLGGALATLTGFDLICDEKFGLFSLNNAEQSVVRTLTFGTPRVGDYFFSNEYNHSFGKSNHLRFVFPGDLLPNVPFKYWGYKHVGTKILLKDKESVIEDTPWIQYLNKKIIQNSILNHSMENYLKHVKLILRNMFV